MTRPKATGFGGTGGLVVAGQLPSTATGANVGGTVALDSDIVRRVGVTLGEVGTMVSRAKSASTDADGDGAAPPNNPSQATNSTDSDRLIASVILERIISPDILRVARALPPRLALATLGAIQHILPIACPLLAPQKRASAYCT